MAQAEKSLTEMFEVDSFEDKTFLDIGSGSGLFSLAARNLGAVVTAFDFDVDSVGVTRQLMESVHPGRKGWEVHEGSVLDKSFLENLGQFDFVYSWGVLHHTGRMREALANAAHLVKPEGGLLFLALYNKQPTASHYWTVVKRAWNRLPWMRPIILLVHLVYPTIPSVAAQLLRKKLGNQETTKPDRGMKVWVDLVDWLGGYPFEVSTPQEIFDFYKGYGFSLTKLRTVGGKMGCNEFVFARGDRFSMGTGQSAL